MKREREEESYEKLDDEVKKTRKLLEDLEKKKKTIESSHEFKDKKIRDLEILVASLQKELAPYRKKESDKRFAEWTNQKCTNKSGCGCKDCNNL